MPVVTASAKPTTPGWCHSFDLSSPQPVAEAAPALVSPDSRLYEASMAVEPVEPVEPASLTTFQNVR